MLKQLANAFSCACAVVVYAAAGSVEAAGRPAQPAVIPRPVEMKVGEGRFVITERTEVSAKGAAAAEAEMLLDMLTPAMGFRLRRVGGEAAGGKVIALSVEPSLRERLGAEGYELNVTPERVVLRAAARAGLFYAGQTLRQLLPAEVYRAAPAGPEVRWSLPCVEITDYPRFAWRGLLIDPARHFIPKRDVMRYLDAMALHKFNRLQIHLTDNQGWRIEIRRYPLLTEVGSRWHNSMNARTRGDNAKIYGGFYTQADIRELVAYAARRHITIVPEIEMPYHAGAAIVAYPRLGPEPDKLRKLPPAKRFGQTGGLVVPRPETIAFFRNVLDEVIELFPGPYIHIGGDEARSERWAKLEEMQALMKREGLKDVHELHSWFIRQMDAHIARRGRKMVGWDEILQGGLAEGATVMSWRGTKGGIAAARAGHDVVMAPTSHTYFDYRQVRDRWVDPPGLGGAVITLEKVYTFEPVPGELSAEQARHVLGGQGQLWGELIPNERHREFMTYPRACALIETLWSPKASRDWADFSARLKHHLRRLSAAGVYYRAPEEQPPPLTTSSARRGAPGGA